MRRFLHFIRKNYIACASALIVCLAHGPGNAAESDTYYLLGIEQVGGAEIKGKDLVFKVNFIFRKAPDNYWIHFEKQSATLVFDIYGARIVADSGMVVRNSQILGAVKVENRETSMALSGEQALIIIASEPGWHFEAQTLDNSIIQLISWKTLEPPKVVKKKNRRVVLYVFAGIVFAAAAFALITFVGQSNE